MTPHHETIYKLYLELSQVVPEHVKTERELELLRENARLQKENENLEAQLSSLIDFTGQTNWVKSELQRGKEEKEYEDLVPNQKGKP